MKIKNILLIIGMILILSLGVFATDYDTNSTVPINAQYTFAGVLTHANANLTVTLPDGNIDLSFSNYPLNEVSAGIFTGTYNTTIQEGKYSFLLIYYDDNWSELGRDTQTIMIGGDVCPSTITENMNSFLMLIIVIVLIALSLIISNSILGILSGIGLLFYSLTIIRCFTSIGILTLGFSLGLMVYFLFKEK